MLLFLFFFPFSIFSLLCVHGHQDPFYTIKSHERRKKKDEGAYTEVSDLCTYAVDR